MIDGSEQRRRMARYLLGEMPEEERIGLEQQCAFDRNLFEELVEVENDLVDSYARGRLSGSEQQQLESYYMATPKRRARAELAKSLASHLSGLQSATSAPARPTRDRQLSPTHAGPLPFWPQAPVMRIAATVLLCVALASTFGVLIVNNLRLRRELTRLRSEQAYLAANQNLHQQIANLMQKLAAAKASDGTSSPLVRPVHTTQVATLTLAPGFVRSLGEENRLVVSPPTTDVRLQFKLDQRRFAAYAVSLATPEGVAILSRNSLKALMTHTHGKVVVVQIAANLLSSGDYIAKVTGRTTNGKEAAVDSYSFRIVNH